MGKQQEIPNGVNNKDKNDTKLSLLYIYSCIERIDNEVGRGVVVKQNNRSKSINNIKNSKLYVNNFDILDKNCHKNLTDIFLKYGELEQDIFIGRDKKIIHIVLCNFVILKMLSVVFKVITVLKE